MWITRDKKSEFVEFRHDYAAYRRGATPITGRHVVLTVDEFKKLFGWTPKQLSHTYVTEIRMDGKINNVS